MHHTRVEFGNGDIRVGHIEEFEQMDASESMLKDPMQKKCVGVQKMVIMCFRSQLEESNYLEEIRFCTLIRDRREIFKENQTGFLQLHFKTHRRMMKGF